MLKAIYIRRKGTDICTATFVDVSASRTRWKMDEARHFSSPRIGLTSHLVDWNALGHLHLYTSELAAVFARFGIFLDSCEKEVTRKGEV